MFRIVRKLAPQGVVRLSSANVSSSVSKVYPSSLASVHDISDNSSVMFGGFGVTGVPENLIQGISMTSARNLTGIAIDVCTAEYGLGVLLETKQVTRLMCAYVGEHESMAELYYSGKVELNLMPMGSFMEKIRCAGAGIPAFYTATGVNTMVQEGNLPTKYNEDGTVALKSKPKESRVLNGREYLLETSLGADFACIKAWKGDSQGNLVFRSTARNSNEDCAKAARVTIAEVEELVEVGELGPDEIHLPGIYVDRVVVGEKYDKLFERVKFGHPKDHDKIESSVPYSKLPPVSTLSRIHAACFPISKVTHGRLHTHSHNMCHGYNSSPPGASVANKARPAVDAKDIARDRIGRRAAMEFQDGMTVNLGIGIPTVAANFVPADINVVLQSENGLLGMGPYPVEGESLADPDLVNAGKEPVTYLPGSSIFGASESFAMIRGKHIDIVLLGCLQVSAKGDIASWLIPGKSLKGMGGAMDLVAGCKKVIVTTTHTDKHGNSKIVPECTFPLTGHEVASMIITEFAVFEVDLPNSKLILKEVTRGVTVDEIRSMTAASFELAPGGVTEMPF